MVCPACGARSAAFAKAIPCLLNYLRTVVYYIDKTIKIYTGRYKLQSRMHCKLVCNANQMFSSETQPACRASPSDCTLRFVFFACKRTWGRSGHWRRFCFRAERTSVAGSRRGSARCLRPLGSRKRSGVLDFTEMAAGNVVDKAADGEGLGNPGMGADLLQLVADIFFDVLERVAEGWGGRLGPGAVLDSGAQVLLGGVHQAAIGMVDDHEFLGAQPVMRHHQGPGSVIRQHATGIAAAAGITLSP